MCVCMCIFKIGKQNNFMKLSYSALIITMRPESFSFHRLWLYFYTETRPHIAINNNFFFQIPVQLGQYFIFTSLWVFLWFTN